MPSSEVTDKDLSTDSFFKDTFEIDDFLSKCTQKSDLLTLRSYLKQYGQVVYEDMIDILKYETNNIVCLAEDLTNLNTKIEELALPISQVKEDIRTLYLAITKTEIDFKEQLEIAHTFADEKHRLHLRMGILASIMYIKGIVASWSYGHDITILERAVNEYSFQYLYSCELGVDEIIKEDFVVRIAQELLELVNEVFLKALVINDSDIIVRCLSMYANLDKQKEAEKLVIVNVVRPVVSKLFTQNYLDGQNNNMQAIYNEAIEFLNTGLYNLNSILDRSPAIKGFNFIINSFWIEVDKQLRDNLSNITAPGNPDLFKIRYEQTQNFIDQIIASTKIPNLYQTNPTFEAHMKRFNLPVYFEIRFQQIAAKFEAELVPDYLNFEESISFQYDSLILKISITLWNCVQRCLHQDVYLVQLSDQLFKLLMLLVSRYITWYKSIVKWPATLDSPVCGAMEKFVMFTLTDIGLLKKLIGNTDGVSGSTFKNIPPQLLPALSDIATINNELFDNLSKLLQQDIITFKIQQCVKLLQQVGSIPRIYRRTNRAIPSECSGYVIEAVQLLSNFHKAYKSRATVDTSFILDVIITNISEKYIELVQEVLKSVCKMEESLKRLKNRNPNTNDDGISQTKSEGMSDETKIREQIQLDVSYFVQQVQVFSKTSSPSSLKKLLEESGVNQN